MLAGVKVEYTKAALADQRGLHQVWRRAGGAIAHVLADAIKRRVKDRGDLAGQQAQPYANANLRYVNPAYPVAGGRKSRSGLKYFRSSAEMHRGTRKGSYDVTGGMWGGLSVVVSTGSSRVLFRGRSVGQSFGAKSYKSGARAGQRRAPKPSNALKASTVLQMHKVSLLALAERELADINDGITATIQRSLRAIGPAAIEYTPSQINSAIEREIVRRLLAVSG